MNFLNIQTQNSISLVQMPELAIRRSGTLSGWFDQAWIINLKRRSDRLARFWKEVEKAQWPFQRPQVCSAIEGNKVGVPKFWQTGAVVATALKMGLTESDQGL